MAASPGGERPDSLPAGAWSSSAVRSLRAFSIRANCGLGRHNFVPDSPAGGQTSCTHPVLRRLAGWPDWIGWSHAPQTVPGA